MGVAWSRTVAADLTVAGALVAAGQAEAWSSGGDLSAILAASATVPLVWRRTSPVLVLGACVLALTALTVQGEDSFTVAQLLGLMLATYGVAVALPIRRAAIGLGVVLAASLANSGSSGSTELGDYVFPFILLGVPWAAGASIRQWRLQAEEMSRLAATLAAERETHAALVVAAERGRIARDLHDSLAQSLNAVVVHAEAAEEALGRDEAARVAASLRRIQDVGRTSLTETRKLLGVLREDKAHGEPTIDQLPGMVDDFRAQGLVVDLDIASHARSVPLSVQAATYRIVQESLSNVVRHSTASRAQVTVSYGDTLGVLVRDDGNDRNPGQESGFGLIGMRERAALLGGRLEAGRRDDGFVVEATLPVGGHS